MSTWGFLIDVYELLLLGLIVLLSSYFIFKRKNKIRKPK